MYRTLIPRAIAANLDAHRANLPNLIAGAAGMFINNVIFLAGIWGMLFAGKERNSELVPYFVALYAVITCSWGGVCFFLGGLRTVGDQIADGALEPMLATPRDPIVLAAISRSSPGAFGDFVMGLVGIGGIAWKLGLEVGLRCLVAVVVSALGFAALFVFSGAIAFFIPRGNAVGHLVTESSLSLSVYPTGKMFDGLGRKLLLLSPAGIAAVLPMEIIDQVSALPALGAALFAALAFMAVAITFFRLGLRRYRAVSLIGARR